MLKKIFFATIGALAVLLALVIFLLPTPKPDEQVFSDNSLAVQNIRVFDGQEIHENYSLIVQDGVITSMGGQIEIPKNIPVIDGSDKTLLPGLIDAHTHTFGAVLKDSLRFGVTANFDMFTSAPMLRGLKDKRTGTVQTDEADLWSAGVLATVPGGHGTQFSVPVETLTKPDEAQAWVARRLAEGSDYIKLVYMPGDAYFKSLDLATASALIKAGHDQSMMVVAHISTLDGAQDMLDAGIDGLVHIFADKPVTEKFAMKAAKDGVFIIPTLTVLASVDAKKPGAALLENPLVAPHLTATQKQSLGTDIGTVWPGYNFELALENTRKLNIAGVVILAGSDAPNPGTTHGASLHQEMAFLVRAGFSPLEALSAATSAPASAFKIKDRGRIAVGARADFVIVSGNPAQDISRTLDIKKIVKNGYTVKRGKQKAPTTSANPPLNASILGTFDMDILPPDNLTAKGFAWSSTDDRMANGNSEAVVSHVSEGADATGGALHVQANVKSGFFFPWAGAFFSHSSQASHNIEAYKTINFQVRGTPGIYKVMVFASGAVGAPPTQDFTVSRDWQEITLDVENFTGFTPKSFVGLAITTGPTPGTFDYDIDNVTFKQ